jgi:hypothetical protein
MERQAYGQNDTEQRQVATCHMKGVQDVIDIADKKIAVLEYRQHANVCHQTHDQKGFSPPAGGILYHDTGYIVYDDRKDEYENIDRDKEHVKDTTGYQQMQPPPAMWQQKIDEGNEREENKKFDRVEEHTGTL